MKEYPQGATIRFMVKFKETSTVTATNFDEMDNAIVYAYAQDGPTVKFSKTPKPGYNTLHRVDEKTLVAAIRGSQSKLMYGDLYIEQMYKDTLSSPEPEEIGVGAKLETGITIVESEIKAEI